VEQGQLWTAEWADVLTSGISAFNDPAPVTNLRRQPSNPDGRPIEFKPRSGGPRLAAPAAAGPIVKAAAAPARAAAASKPPAQKKAAGRAAGKLADKKKPKSAQ
jgi:hypothetical protein